MRKWGRGLLFSVLVFSKLYSDPSPPKVYDCFPFFNELELLEIKLNELYDVVDWFVIVESVETFSGNEKPLYFLENKHKFSPFLDKILHVVVDQRYQTSISGNREHFQKNQIMRGLVNCKDSDIIILEDMDEIVRPEIIPLIKDQLSKKEVFGVSCNQDFHLWFLNVYDKQCPRTWRGSVACRFSTLKTSCPQSIRGLRDYFLQMDHAGWHFSYLGGKERILYKVASTFNSSGDFIGAFNREPDQIIEDKNNLIPVPIDESYPKFIRDNLSKFIDLGFILNLQG